MVDEEILRRIEPVGIIDRIRTAQSAVLTPCLVAQVRAPAGTGDPGRQSRILAGGVSVDVRKGIWRELDGPS
jgi:hypothetical protein